MLTPDFDRQQCVQCTNRESKNTPHTLKKGPLQRLLTVLVTSCSLGCFLEVQGSNCVSLQVPHSGH